MKGRDYFLVVATFLASLAANQFTVDVARSHVSLRVQGARVANAWSSFWTTPELEDYILQAVQSADGVAQPNHQWSKGVRLVATGSIFLVVASFTLFQVLAASIPAAFNMLVRSFTRSRAV